MEKPLLTGYIQGTTEWQLTEKWSLSAKEACQLIFKAGAGWVGL